MTTASRTARARPPGPRQRYESKVLDRHSSHSRIVRALEDLLTEHANPSILDVGCASGVLKQTADGLGLSVARRGAWSGVEIDPQAATAARAAGVDVSLRDIDADPPPNRRFDAVLFADVLEHVAAPAAILARWLPAVCHDRTWVLVSLPNVANLSVRLSLLLGRFEYGERGILDREHLRFFTRRSARRLLHAAGLAVERTWVTAPPALLLLPERWRASGPVQAGQSLLHLGARLAPTLLGYQFVFAARYAPDG